MLIHRLPTQESLRLLWVQPYEDCCTIFVAKHPVTKPNIKVIHKSEENLAEKIDELVKTALETVEVIKCW